MSRKLILASSSATRRAMLEDAGISVTCLPPRVDEATIKASLLAEGATPRDVADALAEYKARKIGERHPEAFVLGADQVLDFQGSVLSKPANLDEARTQLKMLRGKPHKLLTAAVIFHDGQPQWRTVATVRLTMRRFSDAFLEGYLDRNADAILSSVGGYRLEEEGLRLFDRVDGDFFAVLGLPLLDVVRSLTMRGVLEE
ncbi:Maf family protein [Brevirhabdus sp.]|uniref:Maf family protein n=1 Tax=Brevirhabdus sp. TaxID=2004514 RepID=UPI0040598EBD